MSEFPKSSQPGVKGEISEDTIEYRPADQEDSGLEETGVSKFGKEIEEGEIVDLTNDDSGLGPWRVIGYERNQDKSYVLDGEQRVVLLEQAFGPNTVKASEDEVIKTRFSQNVEKLAKIADKLIGTEVEMNTDALNLSGRWKVKNIFTEGKQTFVELERDGTTIRLPLSEFELAAIEINPKS
jgi:hypothetical protein